MEAAMLEQTITKAIESGNHQDCEQILTELLDSIYEEYVPLSHRAFLYKIRNLLEHLRMRNAPDTKH